MITSLEKERISHLINDDKNYQNLITIIELYDKDDDTLEDF